MLQKAHYDSVAQNTITKRSRRQLHTYPLREYNNNIKRNMLTKFVTQPGARILDVCCGRGGDIFKYTDVKPEFVYFIDISSESINEAVRRYEAGRRNINYKAKFGIADCGSNELASLLDGQRQFDVVVCHFSLHYMFANENMIDTFLQTITNFMTPDALFLATFPDYESIRSLCSKKWKKYSNAVMTIDPNNNICEETSKYQFGQEYFFTLEDAVTNCPEFLIPHTLLQHKFRQFGLQTQLHENFLQQSFGVVFNSKSNELREVASIYCAHVAQKIFSINYKEKLEAFCRQHSFETPQYIPYRHYRGWCCNVTVGTTRVTSNVYSCYDRAEQGAAERMLDRLESMFVGDCPADTVFDVASTPDKADIIVHVNMSEASFITSQLLRCYRSVHFIFYCECHTNVHFDDGLSNYTIRTIFKECSANAMMMVSAAQLSIKFAGIPHLLVSKVSSYDSMLRQAELLIPYTTYVTTAYALDYKLENDLGGKHIEFPSTPQWTWPHT